MRPIAVSLRLVASTTLLLVFAYTIMTVTLPMGDVVAQTVVTHEAVIVRQGPPPPEIIVRQAPPPPPPEVRIAPPPSQIWVPGYWSWNNDWVWVPGRAEKPPERMATWVPGQWNQRGDTWVWRSGHWE
jgi:YXWGXW repeat-containing protein